MVTQNVDTMQSASRHGNTPRWAAPEVLSGQPPSKETDIFSFAMVMIEVCHGCPAVRGGLANCHLTGIHWRGSIQYPFHCHVDLGHDARRPPAATDTFDFYRTLVEADATLLASAAPLAPGSFRSFACSSRHVSFSFIPAIIRSPADRFIARRKQPPWKQLLTHTLTTDERTSLITKIFSDRGEVGVVMKLSGDDSQAFIVTIAGVSPPVSSPKHKSIDFDANLYLCELGIG